MSANTPHLSPASSGIDPDPFLSEALLPAEPPLNKADSEGAMQRIYERGDRIVGRFLLLHALLAFALGFVYETWLATSVVTVSAVAMFFISRALMPRSVVTRYLAGLALQCFVALHIYQLHGLAEMHFFFFTGFTVMIVYQDWKCFWPGAFGIIGQHLLFAIMHNSGIEVHFFEADYVGVSKLAYHFGIVLLHVLICGYWSHLLRLQTLHEAWQQRRLENANQRLRLEMAERRAAEEERHVAEEARREAEAQYRRVADNLPGIVYQFARDVDGGYHFNFMSEGSLEMFGVEAREITGKAALLFDLIHEEDRPSMIGGIEESARQNQPFHWEGRIVLANGETKWIKAASRPAAQPDGSMLWDGVVVDISALRIAAAEASEAREEAERANRAKSEFLSRMSHELRTPLNSILGFGQLLARSGLPEKQVTNVDFILSGGRHLLKLVNEVLDIAKIETGNLTLSIEAIGVQQLIDDAMALMRPMADQRAITLTPPPAGTYGHYVLADLQRLNQVLLNLLSNAIKYNKDGGAVTVSCAPFEKEGSEVGSEGSESVGATPWLRIEISDTGFGMREEDLDRLFTPFDRLGAESRAIEGTGIGLALSKRLLEAMGGHINVRTKLDQGSTFYIELPIVDAPARMARAAARHDMQSAESRPKRKILCIEDNLANREVIAGIFADRPDIELMTAIQGRLGLELAREHFPDVILLDAHLPDLPGAEVLVRLQAEPATRKIPVIVVSADATPRQIERLRGLGARDYLTKPFEIEELIDVLDRTLKSTEAATADGMTAA